ncbi:peptidyl-prolyl cis-trans isomerase [Paenibacillus chungangensis]|uniref:peptidylprolyl isomerase n=1 Tax=Paenibacillus chungangensis TaxID=696535 RepID=A0ABW3HX26_9BACL
MRRYNWLKTVVMIQAVCMIALTGAVMVKIWPLPAQRSNIQNDPPALSDDGGSDSQSQSGDHAGEDVAKVGNLSITRQQLNEELYRQYGDEVLRAMLLRRAVDLEAEATGLRVMDEELDRELAAAAEGYDTMEQFLKVMKEQLGMSKQEVRRDTKYRLLMEKLAIRDIVVTDEEVEQYIAMHPEQFEPRLQLHLQWIVTATEAQALDLLERLADGEPFDELAAAYSLDEFTSGMGGDLGIIEADDPFYDEAMLQAAREMEVAEIAGPIAMSDSEGFCIVQLSGRNVLDEMNGRRIQDTVRKQLALERAKPLKKLEEELLQKHGAVVLR